MILLNDKKFAENEKEFTNSLFEKDGTCVGYAKKLKRKINLMDHNKELIGVITKNNVIALATKQSDGKYWYSYGDISLLGVYEHIRFLNDIAPLVLGVDNLGRYYK